MASNIWKEKSFPTVKWRSKLVLFFLVIFISLTVVNFFMPEDFPPHLYNVMLLVLLAIGFWITDVFPAFATSMFVVFYSVYFLEEFSLTSGVSQNWEAYTSTWASPIIWILMGGFFISLGMSVTGLDRRIASLAIKIFGTNPRIFLLGMMLLTIVFSIAISNTATAALMIAVVTPLINRLGKQATYNKSIVLGVAFAATFGGLTTIPGSPVNAIAAEATRAQGETISYMQWFGIGMPLCLFFTLLAWIILSLIYKPKINSVPKIESNTDSKLPSNKEWVVIFTLLVTISLWLTTSQTGIPVAAVSFIPMMILSISGIIQQQHLKSISWETLLLVAGGLTLGVAASNTGLLDYAAAKINLPEQKITALIFMSYITVLLSNFMSSTATASILVPLVNTILPGDVVLVSMATAMCCSLGVLLPISTPPNAIALSTGVIKAKDFSVIGLVAILLGPPVICYSLYFWLT